MLANNIYKKIVCFFFIQALLDYEAKRMDNELNLINTEHLHELNTAKTILVRKYLKNSFFNGAHE